MELIVIAISNIICFIIGAIVGQRAFKNEPVVVNPVETVRKAKDDREARRELSRFEIMMDNIDNYDGTDTGQREVS